MLWLIPQYFTMVTAEVMFYVTAIDFAYTQVWIFPPQGVQINNNHMIFVQAPQSMKSTIQAMVMLCAASGNVIVMITAKANMLEQVL